jgi:hypothetical protein
MDVEVRDVPEQERYEVWAGGELAGFASYRSRPGLNAYIQRHPECRREVFGL